MTLLATVITEALRRPACRWLMGVSAALIVSVSFWLAGGRARAEASLAPDGAALPFVVYAAGVTTDDAALVDRPGGGDPLAYVPGHSAVAIGGVVRSGWLWLAVESYWVRVDDGSGGRFGFLPGGSVAVLEGAPPEMDIDGVDTADLLSPVQGVSTRLASGGTDQPGAGTFTFGVSADGAGRGPADGGQGARGSIGIPWLPGTVRRWEHFIVASASEHGVDPDLVAILTLVESGGHPGALSPSGARGLMQVMPATGADIAGQRSLVGYDPSWLDDPETNIDFGTWYISRMLGMFGRADDPDWLESVSLAAAAYNGGPGNVQRHLAGGSLPAESVRYRGWVSRMWTERHGQSSDGFRSWMDAGGRILVGQAELVAVR